MGKRKSVKILTEKVDAFLEDRKNSNNVLDIIAATQDENEALVLAAVAGLERIFLHAINKGQLVKLSSSSDSSAEEKYSKWLCGCYKDAQKGLLSLCSHEDHEIQEASVLCLMKFVESEGQNPASKEDSSKCFPHKLFTSILTSLLSRTQNHEDLIDKFQKDFFTYADIVFYSMEVTKTLLERNSKCPEVFLNNVFVFLSEIKLPVRNFFTMKSAQGRGKASHLHEHQKLFSQVWLAFLSKELSASLYKRVLVSLHEKVIPNMDNPLFLSDFLIESYKIGGAISLLSLNGLFILINKYNLDFPDFYSKLYQLLQPSVLHVKYLPRFFYLMNLFLSSSHLPAYLVSAFVKRLSRLSLTAPPSALTILIPFIFNLIKRHPSCSPLVHHPSPPSDVSEDPFLMDEMDMTKCHAQESSLWEIQTLQQHYYPGVAGEANLIDQPLPKLETDISDLLETTIQDLADKENEKKYKNVPVTFEPPKGLFGNREDQFHDLWTL